MTLNMSNNGIHIIPANTINPFSGLKKKKLELETSNFKYFKDVVDGFWYAPVVNEFRSKNLIANNELFYPDKDITRGEVAGFIHNFLQHKNFSSKLNYNFVFKDVLKDAWYAQAINTVASNGIMSGNKDYFAPNKFLTRAELSIVLYKTLILLLSENIKGLLPEVKEEPFLDVNTKDWFYKEVCILTELSILIGYKEQTGHYFRPEKSLTRAEFIVSLDKIENYLQEFNVK